MVEKLFIISPRGFCAGVTRAKKTVEESLKLLGTPIYVLHEIVHNKHVCDELKKQGAIFVEELTEIPDNSTCIFSAHGVPPSTWDFAKKKNLQIIDATCPLVAKTHFEIKKFASQGKEIVYIGHKGHAEAEAAIKEKPDFTQLIEKSEDVANLKIKNSSEVAYLTQTTLSVDETKKIIVALKERFPKIISPAVADICYATTNRQEAIKNAGKYGLDAMLIVGSKNSSNSKRLVETSKAIGIQNSYLIDDVSELNPDWLNGISCLGISAGASAPEYLIEELKNYFVEKYNSKIENLNVINENMNFPEPLELTDLKKNKSKL